MGEGLCGGGQEEGAGAGRERRIIGLQYKQAVCHHKPQPMICGGRVPRGAVHKRSAAHLVNLLR